MNTHTPVIRPASRPVVARPLAYGAVAARPAAFASHAAAQGSPARFPSLRPQVKPGAQPQPPARPRSASVPQPSMPDSRIAAPGHLHAPHSRPVAQHSRPVPGLPHPSAPFAPVSLRPVGHVQPGATQVGRLVAAGTVAASKPLPSTRATFVWSAFLGVLWLIPALRASRRADQQGVDGGRHVRAWAAGTLTGAVVGLMTLLLVFSVLLPAVADAAKPSDPWAGVAEDEVSVVVPVPSMFGRAGDDTGDTGTSHRSSGRKRR